ncbi:hypothetical protein SDC9_205255 [bioreactor metagenome]|uniref:Uncharacterized protein n=1 Tax=bioreactor metagenome TaxID=1076179 RepID=A0A645J1U4_9ZZZZ
MVLWKRGKKSAVRASWTEHLDSAFRQRHGMFHVSPREDARDAEGHRHDLFRLLGFPACQADRGIDHIHFPDVFRRQDRAVERRQSAVAVAEKADRRFRIAREDEFRGTEVIHGPFSHEAATEPHQGAGQLMLFEKDGKHFLGIAAFSAAPRVEDEQGIF